MKKTDTKKEYRYIRKTYTYEGKRYYVRGRTEKEAYEKLAELKSALRRGESGISSNMTAAAWCREWLETYIKPRVREPGQPKMKNTMSPKSYRCTYEDKIEKYIIPGLGALKLRDVRDTHLVKILNAEAGKSFSHVSKVRMVIKAVFAQAAASRLIPYDPALNLKLPVTSKGERRSLTDAERSAFDSVVNRDKKHGLYFKVLIGTGVRPGEAAALRVGDIDFKRHELHVCRAVESGTNIVSTPKTDAGNRYIPIPSGLLSELKDAVEDKSPDDLLLPQVTDPTKMMTQICIKRYWQTLYRLMDIEMGAQHDRNGHVYDPSDLKPDGSPKYPNPKCPSKPLNGHVIAQDLTLYCLRHTYCTDLQKAGVPINQAKVFMGHSDISVTANIYTHSSEADVQSALKLINAYNGGASDTKM